MKFINHPRKCPNCIQKKPNVNFHDSKPPIVVISIQIVFICPVVFKGQILLSTRLFYYSPSWDYIWESRPQGTYELVMRIIKHTYDVVFTKKWQPNLHDSNLPLPFKTSEKTLHLIWFWTRQLKTQIMTLCSKEEGGGSLRAHVDD